MKQISKGLALAGLASLAAAGVAAQSIDVSVGNLTHSSVEVTVTPDPDDLNYYYATLPTKNFENGGGRDGYIDKLIDGWKDDAYWYGGVWTDYIPKRSGAETYTKTGMRWNSPYTAFAFGIDPADGTITVPMQVQEFTTQGLDLGDSAYSVKLKQVGEDDRGWAEITLTVTPPDDAPYAVLLMEPRYVDSYDMSDAESLDQFLYYQVAGNISNGQTDLSGVHDVVFDLKDFDTDYVAVVLGWNEVPTTVPTLYAFNSAPFTQTQSLDLELTACTATSAEVRVTPTPEDMNYFFTTIPANTFENRGGREGYIANIIEGWKDDCYYYGGDWTDYIPERNGVQTFSKDGMRWNTAYTSVAFGIDLDGTLTAPLTVMEFTTPRLDLSEEAYGVTLMKVSEDDRGLAEITLTVTPPDDKPYGVWLMKPRFVESYDMSDPESLDQFLYYQVSGNQTLANTGLEGRQNVIFRYEEFDTDYYAVVVGWDGLPTSVPTLLPFTSTIGTNPDLEPATYLEVLDVAHRDVTVNVGPLVEGTRYEWGVVSKSLFDEIGIDNLYERCVRGWWEFVASLYDDDTTWEYVAEKLVDNQPFEGTYSEYMESRAQLDWDTDYIAYAFAIDENYVQSSAITTAEFRTLPCNHSDNSFTAETISVEDDELDPEGKAVKVTVHVDAENDDTWSTHIMLRKYYDFYVDNPDYTMDDFEYNQVFRWLEFEFSGSKDMTWHMLERNKDYVMPIVGWDGAPTTEVYLHFLRTELSGVDAVNEAGICVAVHDGMIMIDGEYDAAALFTVDGKVAGAYRNVRSIQAEPGMYIVKVKAGDTTVSRKVTVK